MKKKRIPLKEIILKTIAFTGMLSVALVAPNALQMLKPFLKKKKYYPSHIDSNLIRLERKGLIKYIKNSKGKMSITLTKEGERFLSRVRLGEAKLKKPKYWDGKWRIIIFDIREQKRRSRDLLRFELQNTGFKQLQKSVWVYPYPCDELLQLFKTDLLLGRDVLSMIVEKIENDNWLKKEFHLS